MASLLLCAAPSALRAQDTCPEAPNDGSTPADSQINTCLARSPVVWLSQGTYLITATINFRQNGGELRSVPGQTATLLASTGLVADVLYAGQHVGNNYSVHDLHINGSIDAGRACVAGQGANLRADGSGFAIFNIESIHAPCANFQIGGSNFNIHHNFLWHSGTAGGVVGDGLGVFSGSGGEVAHNTIADATDIGLVAFGGSRWIHHNLIQNVSHRGLTGFNVGSENGGNHTGAVYENNQVQSAFNMLAIGILLGAHPWQTAPEWDVSNAGTVRFNSSDGAVINMVVDGIANIQAMHDNTTSNHQGDQGLGPDCHGYEYTAWHFGGPIQGGWSGLQYDRAVDGFACVPQG